VRSETGRDAGDPTGSALRSAAMAIDANGLFWWHAMELPDGTVTPGDKSQEILRDEWKVMDLLDLTGRSVVDIGAWDGWFSFQAEAAGAQRVVAVDEFVWSLDLRRAPEYWEYVHEREARNEPYDQWGPGCKYWDSDTLVGKRSFNLAREAFNSRVESIVTDFMECDLQVVGTFDVAFFLGVLYHVREPLRALERVRAFTKELAVIETAAIELPDRSGPFLEFVPGYEINKDPTNWFFPTEEAVIGMCHAAGFSSVEPVGRLAEHPRDNGILDYRLTVHARP
jgi:tRNA (mo5U34)-methyltransferase